MALLLPSSYSCIYSVGSSLLETSSTSFSYLCYIFHAFAFLCLCKNFTAGNVVCSWGRGEDGQLGHGDAEDRLLPTQLSALDDHEIVSITCGADHTIAYSQSRVEVYSWGWYVYLLLI